MIGDAEDVVTKVILRSALSMSRVQGSKYSSADVISGTVRKAFQDEFYKHITTESARKGFYVLAGVLTMIGIFAMRWNVVIGGQLFSKSFLGYTTYKMGFATREGLLTAIVLMVLPLVILWALLKLLPPWKVEQVS